MLKDLEFSHLEIVSATKNITDLYNQKDFNITITMVPEEHSLSNLSGLERLLKETWLQDEKKLIKLSCTYTKTDDGKIELPIKVMYNGSTQKYSKRAYYEHDLTPDIFEDINFVESFFERSPDNLKRVYM